MTGFVEEPIYAQLARVGKALANPVRLRLLDLLDGQERTVEQLAEQSGVPLKNTSAQLQQLRATHLVRARKVGTRVHYRLADAEVSRFLGVLQGFAEHRLADLRDAVDAHLATPAQLQPVSVDELAARLDDPATLVLDVRSAAEYERAHIPGAVSVPAADIRDWLDSLPRDRDSSGRDIGGRDIGGRDIVAYCNGPYCVASPRVAQFLHERGHRARPLEGGFIRWSRAHR